MHYLAFDIETIGKQYDALDEQSQKYLRDWAERDSKNEEDAEQELEKIKQGLPLSPFLGEIVTIAMIDDNDKGAVYFRADEDSSITDSQDGDVQYRPGSEKEILQRFWNVAAEYKDFVTFNGRGFDAPYLIIRSAVHHIRPSVNLMSNRYLGLQRGTRHFDLQDLLSFYGALWKRPKLHFVTQAFGIESPKTGGMDGEEVPQAFADKRYMEIARYCMEDARATKKVFEIWHEYMNFEVGW
jgi:3'-5' exonuclease